MHESGQRSLSTEAAKRYADCLGVDFVWLLHGAGDSTAMVVAGAGKPLNEWAKFEANQFLHNLLNVPGDDELGRVLGAWQIPNEVISKACDVPKAGLRIVQMDSDDMEPTMRRGDPVLVDLGVTSMTAAGIYLLRSEHCYYFRRVEPLPGRDPPELRLSCDNMRYQPSTVRLDKVSVRGRALGVVTIQKL
jgi:hypothetical protein